eukprot:gene4577-5718_t
MRPRGAASTSGHLPEDWHAGPDEVLGTFHRRDVPRPPEHKESLVSSANSLTVDDLGSAAQRDRRKRILDATYELARDGGFDAVQMRAVADKAEVALGTLYRYFPSKIHLLVSALASEFERAEAAFRDKPIPGDT